MAKTVKKKNNRRMRRTVRKTVGALFMVSAITIAAIPAENLQAIEPERTKKVTVDMKNCRIPIVPENETIYTTGDGRFQFAYVNANDTAASNKVAVILGYAGGRLQDGVLNIPDTVDAYMKYSENLGTEYGYCAVGKSGNFLYYEAVTEKKDEFGNVVTEPDKSKPILDDEGNVTYDPVTNEPLYETKPVYERGYMPCYYNDYDKWSNLDVEDFYYQDGTTTDADGNQVPNYVKTKDTTKQRIQTATVTYIGNQRLQAGSGDNVGTWSIVPESEGGLVDTPEEGIFRGEIAGNIETLNVGENLSGIGDYAFYGCTNLSSIKLGNGLDTVGNYAFSDCINLEAIDVDIIAMVSTIGDHAFYNCRALKSFTMPRQVAKIGDSAFEGCEAMESVELTGAGKNVQLSTLGYDVFKGCSSLKEVILPKTYQETDLDISMWEGCESLEHIKIENTKVNFVENSNSDFGFDEFKETVPASFYFEGPGNATLHQTATTHSIAYKYDEEDVYEKVEELDGGRIIFQVNSNNELVNCEISGSIKEVQIPAAVGPYHITSIYSDSFKGNCGLERIVIPSSIEVIEAEAFKGCHNLKTVIFDKPVNLKTIGKDAFKTQDVTQHSANCTDQKLDKTPTLQFVGPIDTESIIFKYAMDPGSNINSGSQQRSYITYYSSWPQNLQVRYNSDKGKVELINYMTFKELQDFKTITTKEEAVSRYPYMTATNWEDYVEAATEAVRKSTDASLKNTMSDYEKEIYAAATDIVLPAGIEAVADGLFKEKESDPSEPDIAKSLTTYGLTQIPDNFMSGCKNFKKVNIMGNVTSVGNYAFKDCTKLDDMTLPNTVTSIGKVPFKGCTALKDVSLNDNPKYVCTNGIIFEKDSAGNKIKIVEVLAGRENGVVTPEEVAGVLEICEQAFAGTNVSKVDLRDTGIQDIPKEAFADTKQLFEVDLPSTWNSISDDAFKNSNLQYLEIPGAQGFISNTAFDGRSSGLTFCCEDGSSAKVYADKNGIKTTSMIPNVTFTVRFWNGSELIDTQTVKAGEDAKQPENVKKEGYVLTGWSPDYKAVSRDLDCVAQFEAEDPNLNMLTVKFVNYDDSVLKTVLVDKGQDAEPPVDPVREGYTFIGWKPAVSNIQENTTIYAQYEKKDSSESQVTVRFIDYDDKVLYTQKVTPGESPITPQNPTRAGYKFTGWRPAIVNVTKDLDTYAQYEKEEASPSPSPSASPNNNSSSATDSSNSTNSNSSNNSSNSSSDNGGNGQAVTSKLYTLTVKNGSGSGSYAAGSQPIIIANDPAEGQEFSGWTVSPESVKLPSYTLSATVLNMPEENVTVTANYKTKTTNNSQSGTDSSNTTTPTPTPSPRPNGSNVTSNTTSVVIDKNGLSNTGMVSVTVNGSSDRFTVKVKEDAAATEAAINALRSEYGDLAGIYYFPMDISLYDSTGENKVTDTTGLSVKITLPLPDSMITYAGNNKVASVVDGKLEKLDAKFSSISGVSCVTFTANHFSPYVIYVDTNHLSSGKISDATPKTGDGVHPKWFLSGGLASASLFLFFKKDKKNQKKAKVKA